MHHVFEQPSGVMGYNTCLISTLSLAPPPCDSAALISANRSTPTFPLFFSLSVPGSRAKKIIFILFELVLFWEYERIGRNRGDRARARDIVRLIGNGGASETARRAANFVCSSEAYPPQGAEAAESHRDHGSTGRAKRSAVQFSQLPGCAQRFRGLLHDNPGGNC